jgi:tetratricopeptide (TPR) repeat protein
MIAERHYDEEALINIAASDPESEEFRDPHLLSCSSCAEALAAFRSISEVLRDDSAWEVSELRDDPSPETVARLREYAIRKDDEDDQASWLVSELLRDDRANWAATATRDIRYHTAGVAAELIRRSEAAVHTAPPDAVEIGRAALAVAEAINENEYELNVVRRLRGQAGRQYAYSLFYTDDGHRALRQVERAAREFERCGVADYDLARLNVVRALVYRSLERHEEAVPLTKAAARVFEAYGDRQRLSSAYLAEAYLYLHMSRYRDALPVLRAVERMSSHVDTMTRALTAGNVGLCLWQLGQIPEALAAYQFASALFDEIGVKSEAVRIRAQVAALLRAEGQVDEARRRLVLIAQEARDLSMECLAITVQLELAEIYLMDGRLEEARSLCLDAFAYFERSGITQAAEALEALAYLKEVAAQQRLTRETVRHVKKYIERVEREPNLLFAPPPAPLD